MFHKIVLFTIAVVFCLLFTGCPQYRPEGMPPLYPCKITITQENKPLAGATVTLFDQSSEDKRWSSGGITDAQGNIQIKTWGKYQGTSIGKYKITVTKQELEEVGNKVNYFSLVELKHTKMETTPFEIEVTTKGATQIFDVGKPVKELIGSSQLRPTDKD
jgi:hypothetical protein